MEMRSVTQTSGRTVNPLRPQDTPTRRRNQTVTICPTRVGSKQALLMEHSGNTRAQSISFNPLELEGKCIMAQDNLKPWYRWGVTSPSRKCKIC